MMQQPPIELLRERDFGQKINATFEFVSQNFRSLVLALIYIAGPPALLAGIAQGVLASNMLGLRSNPDQIGSFILAQYLSYSFLVSLVFSLVAAYLVAATVYSFMALYEEESTFTVSEPITPGRVWSKITERLGTGIGAALLAFVITLAGMIILVLPGIYAAICLQFVLMVVIREGDSADSALGRSYRLVEGKWWSTFGLLVVMGLIAGVISIVFQIPSFILTILGTISLLGDKDSWNDHGILVMLGSVISIVGSTLVRSLIAVAMGFQYYNLVERVDGTGLRTAIENIGSPDTPRPDTEEDF
ncbi:hypothetical protein GCM10027275_44760 [Rhabdobacter roseus]|uniref:DUF7847 domain-containing protein n=1 Tax=Rhabdobacter roseus TaxID=1655419 RepID=A0A840TUD3_9BACT|nr:hypothetical protein [Rhabdobacter roseus]MBB5286854.1 hypothetical protein [Rhabdobacter roseus]